MDHYNETISYIDGINKQRTCGIFGIIEVPKFIINYITYHINIRILLNKYNTNALHYIMEIIDELMKNFNPQTITQIPINLINVY